MLSEAKTLASHGLIPFTTKLSESVVTDGDYLKTSKVCKNRPNNWNTIINKSNYQDYVNDTDNCMMVLTGEVSGIYVLDIDIKKEWQSTSFACGYEFWNNVTQHKPKLDTPMWRTGNGGLHIAFKYTKPTPNRVGIKIYEKRRTIDIRGDNGYIIVPPTSYKSYDKKTKKSYEWINTFEDYEPMIMPEWLEDLLNTPGNADDAKHEREQKKKKDEERKRKEEEKKVHDKYLEDVCSGVDNDTKSEVEALLDLLSPRRADEFEDWMYVGQTLKNISDYDTFDKWSKTCPERYNEAENKMKWDSWNTEKTISTLHKMAKEDSPDKYIDVQIRYWKILFHDEFNEDYVRQMANTFRKSDISLYDKELPIIRYMNQYLGVLVEAPTVTYVKLSYKDGKVDDIHTYCNRNDMIYAFENLNIKLSSSPPKNCLKMWFEHPKRKTYGKKIFEPYINDDIERYDLNIFTGYPNRYDKDFQVDKDTIRPVLHHIYYVLCNENKEAYNYLLDLWACILQDPTNKPGIATVFTSKPGSGKNTIIDWFGEEIIGKKWSAYIQDMNDITGRFTSMKTEKLYMVLDECNTFAGNHKEFNFLKTLITQKKERCEHKNKDAYEVNSYKNLCFLSNEVYIIKCESGDRRYFCCRCSDRYKGNNEYFKKLRSELAKESTKKNFYHYLMQRDYSDRVFMDIPNTKYRQDLIDNTIPLEHHFAKNFFTSDNFKEDTFISYKTLLSKFVNWAKDEGYHNKSATIRSLNKFFIANYELNPRRTKTDRGFLIQEADIPRIQKILTEIGVLDYQEKEIEENIKEVQDIPDYFIEEETDTEEEEDPLDN